MDKIIFSNGESLEFKNYESLTFKFEDKTVEELEKIFIKENTKKIQLQDIDNNIYGIFYNLECTSITKDIKNNIINVNLKQLSELEVKVEQLQATVDTLVVSGLEG